MVRRFAQETDRMSSRRALGLAFVNSLPLVQPSGSSHEGVTKGGVRSRKEDKGVPGRADPRETGSSSFRCGLGLAGRLSHQYEMPSPCILQLWSATCSDLLYFV